ncbi:endonuclease V, partial [Bacillus spizizenii]|nr:endonuclease V [Bacillus spizizenii]
MKLFDVHNFDMKKEQDFLQIQFNLKNRINLSPSITPDSINTC